MQAATGPSRTSEQYASANAFSKAMAAVTDMDESDPDTLEVGGREAFPPSSDANRSSA